MITRYAHFAGPVQDGKTEEFRKAVLERLAPKVRQLPGILKLRVNFVEQRDDAAPEYPLMLALVFPDMDAMNGALASQMIQETRAIAGDIVKTYLSGEVHHHVAITQEF